MDKKLYDTLQITDLKDMLKKTGEAYGEKIAYTIKTGEKRYKNFTHKEVRDMVDALRNITYKPWTKRQKDCCYWRK